MTSLLKSRAEGAFLTGLVGLYRAVATLYLRHLRGTKELPLIQMVQLRTAPTMHTP